MPLTVADTGEEYVIKRIGGKPEVKQHLENLGFVVGGGGVGHQHDEPATSLSR